MYKYSNTKELNHFLRRRRRKYLSFFAIPKQRYRCKRCKYNFTRSTCWRYSDEIRQKAIKLYLEGNGFRRIERLIHVSHMSVINWVRQLASKIQKIPKKSEKVDILELDEMCINFKKKYMALDSCKSSD